MTDERIHLLPELTTGERMHILDIDCWCEPIPDGEYIRHG